MKLKFNVTTVVLLFFSVINLSCAQQKSNTLSDGYGLTFQMEKVKRKTLANTEIDALSLVITDKKNKPQPYIVNISAYAPMVDTTIMEIIDTTPDFVLLKTGYSTLSKDYPDQYNDSMDYIIYDRKNRVLLQEPQVDLGFSYRKTSEPFAKNNKFSIKVKKLKNGDYQVDKYFDGKNVGRCVFEYKNGVAFDGKLSTANSCFYNKLSNKL